MISRWASAFNSSVRALGRTKQFNEGHKIDSSDFSSSKFKNDYQKLVLMYQIRQYFTNHTPYAMPQRLRSHDKADLQKQINFHHSRIMFRRVLFVFFVIFGYSALFMEEEARDWKDKFDLKMSLKVYGSLEDNASQGTSAVDD